MQNCYITRRVQSLGITGFQFISALIALLTRGREIDGRPRTATVITAIYTPCDHDIIIIMQMSMQQAIT